MSKKNPLEGYKVQPDKPEDGSWKNESARQAMKYVDELVNGREEFRRRFDAFEQDLKNVNGRTQLLIQEMKVLRAGIDRMDEKPRQLSESRNQFDDESTTTGE